MRRHIVDVHGHTDSRVACNDCDATFATYAACAHHVSILHGKKKEARKDGTTVSDLMKPGSVISVAEPSRKTTTPDI